MDGSDGTRHEWKMRCNVSLSLSFLFPFFFFCFINAFTFFLSFLDVVACKLFLLGRKNFLFFFFFFIGRCIISSVIHV